MSGNKSYPDSELLFATFNLIEDPVFMMDAKGVIKHHNSAAKKVVSDYFSEVSGKSIFTVFPDFSSTNLLQELDSNISNEVFDEQRGVFYTIRSQKVETDTGTSIIVYLKVSSKQYKTVIDDQTQLIVRYDLNGLCTFANQAYCKLMGWGENDFLGKNILQKADKERDCDT